MAISEAQARAVKKYQDANYDFIKIRLNKGQKEIIEQMAKEAGKSRNQFILDCVLGN